MWNAILSNWQTPRSSRVFWARKGVFLREKSYKKCLFFPSLAFDGQLDPYGPWWFCSAAGIQTHKLFSTWSDTRGHRFESQFKLVYESQLCVFNLHLFPQLHIVKGQRFKWEFLKLLFTSFFIASRSFSWSSLSRVCFNLMSHIYAKCLDQKHLTGHKLKFLFNMLESYDLSFLILYNCLKSPPSTKVLVLIFNFVWQLNALV